MSVTDPASTGSDRAGDDAGDVAGGIAGDAASLAGTLLDAESERSAAQAACTTKSDSERLVGVGDAALTLRQGIATGGAFTFIVLLLLNSLDELEAAALSVLAPDIRDTFGISNGTIVFISSAAASFMILGAMPMGWMADRYRRSRIVGITGIIFSVMVVLSGFAVNAFNLFCTRFGVGVAKSSTITAHGTLLADTYPIGVRGRITAMTMGCGAAIGALSPVLVGLVAHIAGGPEGWRWVFYLLGLPVLILGVIAFRIKDPQRGQQEMLSVIGEVVDTTAAKISVEAAFSRLRQIGTLRTVWAAFAALGFGLFTGPVISGIYLEERFGIKTLERGFLVSIGAVAVIAVLPFSSRRYDANFRTDPTKALRMIGLLLMPVALVIPIQYAMPNVGLFVAVGIVAQVLQITAFSMTGPVVQSVTPYRLRGLGSALGSVYVFFIGATGGALLAGFLTDTIGPRSAIMAIMIPSTLVGGALLLRGAMSIRGDLAALARELDEEHAENERRTADPDSLPSLQVNGIDFSYGNVQVLFDVGFEVRRGEVLALLGTNGAGKSTILRVIAGLGTPSRGVVRKDGETITYVSPEQRGRLGIRLLPGGKGVFPTMTVRENLEVAGFVYRNDSTDFDRRVARVLELFPELSAAIKHQAGQLSGGQQQMLALAATLMHEPEVLIIDELSLGLAPLVVQRLLSVLEQLKSQGTTMVIVEQSINVALAIADRAVFLEKGRVQFQGDARELLERGDLVRAVFLGTEGG